MAAVRIYGDNFGNLALKLLRVVGGLYCIAVSISVLPGTGVAPLAGIYLSAEAADLLGRSFMFILGYFVLAGILLRPAAILLGMLMFWSSFIVHFEPNANGPLNSFWFDLGLVAVMLLSYRRIASQERPDQTPVSSQPRPVRRFSIERNIEPDRVAPTVPSGIDRLKLAYENAANQNPVKNIFLEDMDTTPIS